MGKKFLLKLSLAVMPFLFMFTSPEDLSSFYIFDLIICSNLNNLLLIIFSFYYKFFDNSNSVLFIYLTQSEFFRNSFTEMENK